MARLDVFRLRSGLLVVDVQANLLDHLASRVVIPIEPLARNPNRFSDLNPIVVINDEPHVLLTQSLVAIPTRDLRRPIASLAPHHDAILRALDLLLTGL